MKGSNVCLPEEEIWMSFISVGYVMNISLLCILMVMLKARQQPAEYMHLCLRVKSSVSTQKIYFLLWSRV